MKMYFKRNKDLNLMIAIMTLVFIALYFKYIFGDYIYAFSSYGDLGSDTMHSYYPIYMFFSKLLHGGNIDLFSMQLGLGTDVFSVLNYVLNPFDLMVVLFPSEYLHHGIILGTYLKMLFTMIFAYKLFKMYFKDKNVIYICTMLWTFSSFMVIWGQHYFFATSITFFTMLIYYVHLFLQRPEEKHIKLIIIITLSAISSYYFFYISGLFSAIYIIIYCIYKKYSILTIAKRLFGLLLRALLGIGISAIFLFPTLTHFFSSTRVPTEASLNNLLQPYGLKSFFTYLSRIFSTDLLGDPMLDNYTGSGNYYEAPLLFTSVLFLFASVFELFFIKGQKLIKIFVVVMYLFVLNIPLVTYFLTFNAGALRWTFLLSFFNVILIGHFISNFKITKKAFKYVLSVCTIFLIVLVIILLGHKLDHIHVRKLYLCIIILFVISFCIVFLCFKNSLYFKQILLGLVCVELIVMNYPGVNLRGSEKSEVFLSHYNDGAEKAVKFLKEYDTSLYRVQKNYISKHLNDAYIQGYNGTTIYSSTNSKELLNYYNSFLLQNIYRTQNCIEFGSGLYLNATLLGTKYLITNGEIIDANYTLLTQVENKYIYENNHYLPFGYVYSEEIDKSDFEKLTQIERTAIESKYFYTENTESILGAYQAIHSNVTNRLPGMPLIKNQNFRNSVINIKDSTQIEFDLTNQPIDIYDKLEIISSGSISTINLFYDLGNGYAENAVVSQTTVPEINNYLLNLGDITDVKKVKAVITSSGETNFSMFDFVSYNYETIYENLDMLSQNSLKNIRLKDNCMSASLISEKDGMLVIPFIYDSSYKVRIDGEDVKTYNVNGGLLGVLVKSGNHDIEILYKMDEMKFGGIITLLSIVLLLIYRKINLRKFMLRGIRDETI